MNQTYTKREREHLRRVKELHCSVCDAYPPSEAHHMKQSNPYTCIALCDICHRGKGGIHGDKTLWRINKMDENDALNVTIKRLMENI